MAICPFAVYRPVINHGGPVIAHSGLVIHVQVGNGSTYGQDMNPNSQVSDTFWCGKDGTLEQHIDTDFEGWTQMSGNSTFAGVECEGFPNEPMTPAQISTLGKLYAWGHITHGWLLQTCDHDGVGLTTHSFYPSGIPDPNWGNHPCPGDIRRAQVPEILAAAKALVNPPPPPQPIPHPGDEMYYVAMDPNKKQQWLLFPNGTKKWIQNGDAATAAQKAFGGLNVWPDHLLALWTTVGPVGPDLVAST